MIPNLELSAHDVTVREKGFNMDFRSRVLGRCVSSREASPAATPEVNYPRLVRQLLLFEKVLVQSHRLCEIPQLVDTWGFDGTIKLLDSNAMDLVWDYRGTGVQHVSDQPLFRFDVVAYSGDASAILNSSMQGLRGLPLHRKQISKLEAKVTQRLIRPPNDATRPGYEDSLIELGQNRDTLREALRLALKRHHGLDLSVEELRLELHRDGGQFVADTNIVAKSGLSDEQGHQVVSHALAAICAVNFSIENMREFSAVSTFADLDAPLVDAKLSFLLAQLAPESQEQRFTRVIELAGLPTVNDPSKVDLPRLLEIRESDECREFRQWLRDAEHLSDDEIASRVGALRTRLGNALDTTVGRSIRFLATFGAGVIPGAGLVTGTAAGAVDSFLIDKVFPRSGPISFLTRLYPSVFDSDS